MKIKLGEIRIKAQEKVRGNNEGYANDTFFTETHISADVYNLENGKRQLAERIKPKLLSDIPRKIKITK